MIRQIPYGKISFESIENVLFNYLFAFFPQKSISRRHYLRMLKMIFGKNEPILFERRLL
jgi:hypothetical protein